MNSLRAGEWRGRVWACAGSVSSRMTSIPKRVPRTWKIGVLPILRSRTLSYFPQSIFQNAVNWLGPPSLAKIFLLQVQEVDSTENVRGHSGHFGGSSKPFVQRVARHP